MIAAQDFIDECKGVGLRFFSGTPCSYLKPFINAVIDDPGVQFRDAVNEGDAVAMVAGAHIAGLGGVAIFQNSGFGNAVNALTSLIHPFQIPLLLIITHRGQPGGPPDEPQHELMGEITNELLDTLRIRWEAFPRESGEVSNVLNRARSHMLEHSAPYALVMAKGSVADYKLQQASRTEPIGTRSYYFREELDRGYAARSTRAEVLREILANRRSTDVIIATTGYTGRELYALDDDKSHLYMVGSMGSASAFGLGVALNVPSRRIVVIDGDGAALMRMGNLASVGAFHPTNFFHMILDNEAHESTGGQGTVSRDVSFGAVAQACGYRDAVSSDSLDTIRAFFGAGDCGSGPSMLHFRIRSGALKDLGRPTIRPHQVKERFMRHLQL